MSIYRIEGHDRSGKRTFLETVTGTRAEARAVARSWRARWGKGAVMERWIKAL